ncbi:hypothetical protein HanIR_Chr15g0731141 [Helianthus annuus]|nr:hypothetical protein HanIR_Chr15g0731141 [Helianthus annuus]
MEHQGLITASWSVDESLDVDEHQRLISLFSSSSYEDSFEDLKLMRVLGLGVKTHLDPWEDLDGYFKTHSNPS